MQAVEIANITEFLFIGKLPEFKRAARGVLRQPLENGFITGSCAAAPVAYITYFDLHVL